MKKLVIVESPSKSKTIEKYLGKDYSVTPSKGHIRDLATSGKGGLGIDIENGFVPRYIVNNDKKDVVKDLKNQVKKADEVYLATDPDREGEAIAWHLAQELDLDLNKKNRVVFNEITKNAVIKAFDNPGSVDMDMVHSQETRRMLDRIIGFRLSSLLKSKIGSKSAGRVQSVALKLVCDREKEVQAFVPQEYWSIHADFRKDRKDFTADLAAVREKETYKRLNQKDIPDEKTANELIEKMGEEFRVVSLEKETKKTSPYFQFTTSSLQQAASSVLHFSAKKTMQVAQMLYEGIAINNERTGLITYMRTDSLRLSPEFVGAALSKIEKEYGKQYVGSYRNRTNANAQDAHEAIRPTYLENEPEAIRQYLTNDQYRLYKLIYIRTLSSLMAPKVVDTLTAGLDNNGYLFEAKGSRLVFDGFLKLYKEYDSSKESELPELLEEEILASLEKPYGKQHFTEGPKRYTEATLIKALEEKGIGRPSTYAMILDTIVARSYVSLEKASDKSRTRYFVPTEQGNLTNESLQSYFSSIINENYTAAMESDLDRIAEGKEESLKVLTDFYNGFEPLVENAKNNMEKKQPEKTGEICPLCGHELVIRSGRYGKFVSCSNFPACRYTSPLEKKEKEEPEVLDIACPECGKPLIRRKNRYGQYFTGCSGYPDCHYIKPEENGSRRRYVRRKAANE